MLTEEKFERPIFQTDTKIYSRKSQPWKGKFFKSTLPEEHPFLTVFDTFIQFWLDFTLVVHEKIYLEAKIYNQYICL